MSEARTRVHRLDVATSLHQFIEHEVLPGTGIKPKAFWSGFDAIVADLAPKNAALLAERKRLQVLSAPHKSARARMLKIADKTANLRSVRLSPPSHWDEKRRHDYFAWAREVVEACGEVSPYLLERFEEAHKAGAG